MILRSPEIRRRRETSQYDDFIRDITTSNLSESDEKVKDEYEKDMCMTGKILMLLVTEKAEFFYFLC